MSKTLYSQWMDKSYSNDKEFWEKYQKEEEKCLKKLLSIESFPILNTIENFTKIFDVDIITFVGFLDGINDSLKTQNNMETLTKETIVTLDYDPQLLYNNMKSAKCDMSIWGTTKYSYLNDNEPLPCTLTPQEIAHNNQVAADWFNKPKCPICGSTNLSKISTMKKAAKIAAFGIFGMGDNGKTWKCNNCGSRF